MPTGLTDAVLDTLPVRIAVIDESGRIVETNAAWRAFTAEHDHPLVPDDEGPYLDALRQSGNDQAVIVAGRLQGLVDGDGEASGECPYHADADAFERIMTAATHTKELTEAVGDLAGILGTADPELEPIELDGVLRTEIERIRSNFDYRSRGEGPRRRPAHRGGHGDVHPLVGVRQPPRRRRLPQRRGEGADRRRRNRRRGDGRRPHRRQRPGNPRLA